MKKTWKKKFTWRSTAIKSSLQDPNFDLFLNKIVKKKKRRNLTQVTTTIYVHCTIDVTL